MTATATTTTMLVDKPRASTQYVRQDGRVWFTRMCGVTTTDLTDAGSQPRTLGVALIQADGRRYEGADLVLESIDEAPAALTCRWRIGASGLRLTTTWQADDGRGTALRLPQPNNGRGTALRLPQSDDGRDTSPRLPHSNATTGIISRRDTIENTASSPVTLSRCLARLALSRGQYECYTQRSRWSHENQGAWQPLVQGLTLRHAWGRTTEDATPYLVLRPLHADHGLAVHILPRGNWTIRVNPVAEGGEMPCPVIELGLADENLQRVLQPGETFALPEILFQPLPQGEPHLGAPALHRYLLAHHFTGAKPFAPIVYNTWFEQFDILELSRLRAQLAAARETGCEVFVIDAGWYGVGGPNWFAQAGDWREKTEAAFCGRMRDFAAEVRAAGLGFGIWMEPERFGPEAPIRTEHPEWFISTGVSARIDLLQPAAYQYLRSEIARLVETYDLAWMKLDFNFTLDADTASACAELADYTSAWHCMLDDIRATYPRAFFEGCSSGAMRGDLATLSHVDGHFLSDTVNPTDVIRISQGAWLRLPPGRLTRWAVLRSAGQALPRYGLSVADSPATILTPQGALWEPSETVDPAYALLAAMPGMLGFSGDLAGLPAAVQALVREHIAFYKQWREFITGSIAHLLTPPEPLTHRTGWVAMQLQSPTESTSLVFVYRLGVTSGAPRWMLRDLNPTGSYLVQRPLVADAAPVVVSGAELMTTGFDAGIPAANGTRNSAATVVVVKPVA